MPEAKIRVRPATAEDRDLLLEWANEPDTRAAGFHRQPILPAEHDRWLAAQLAHPELGRIWIGLVGTDPFGVVRVERSDEEDLLIVSISVDRSYRGRGLSEQLLGAGIAAAREAFPGLRLRAWVRADNSRSVRLFSALGFVPPPVRPPSPPGAPSDVLVLERD